MKNTRNLVTISIWFCFTLFFAIPSCSSDDMKDVDLIEEEKQVEEIEEVEEEKEVEVVDVPRLLDDEDLFYTIVSNSNYNKNLVTDYNADIIFSTDDSVILQEAIDDVSANGGGILTIPEGNFSFDDIHLKSNVHLKIDENAVIRPTDRNDTKNYSIFHLGVKNQLPIENISITSTNGNKFKVDFTQVNNPNVQVVNCNKVTNFLISDIMVDDVYTKFSVVTMGGDDYNNSYQIPENGIVKNIHVENAHYGYGTVQTQSATNILFKDLSGVGGATLRLETGFTGLNDLQVVGQPRVGGLDKIVGRNISCTNGNSAVMISPHAMHNGVVDIEGVTTSSAGFAVRIESGFISNKYDQTIGLTQGTFEFVYVKDVKATYGENAELKSKHFGWYPSEIADPSTSSSYDDAITIGPSIAAILADANYTCKAGEQTVFVQEPIEVTGFLYQENIIPEEFVNTDCSN
ncbi:glycoside hydrolase family protein [Lutibacter citreus]|uniref:Iota-carrageenase A2 n=1 Tax=Lutibacter citreus TaxID=2138210 RepID=UPI000DBE0275|nr:Iota-carrageenase A2 [Lutibacter citreus]